MTCTCQRHARCASCIDRDGLTKAEGGHVNLLSWLIQGARGGKGFWPFNVYRWKSDN